MIQKGSLMYYMPVLSRFRSSDQDTTFLNPMPQHVTGIYLVQRFRKSTLSFQCITPTDRSTILLGGSFTTNSSNTRHSIEQRAECRAQILPEVRACCRLHLVDVIAELDQFVRACAVADPILAAVVVPEAVPVDEPLVALELGAGVLEVVAVGQRVQSDDLGTNLTGERGLFIGNS